MDSIEYARVQTADGTQVRRPEAERSLEMFRRALEARGGQMPTGMRWSESRGFFHGAGRTMTLAEARERNREVAREIEWEQLRLKLGPRLAALAAKLDRAMR